MLSTSRRGRRSTRSSRRRRGADETSSYATLTATVCASSVCPPERIAPPRSSSGHMRISTLRTAVLAFVVIAHPLPAAAQVDQQRAQEYFKEAREICEREGGRL